MRALLQRVSNASVTVEGQTIGEIGPGLLVLLCAMEGDNETQADILAKRISKLRIFKDAEGKMNRSIQDTGGAILLISQFTLAADTSRGNRPGFSSAAPPEVAEDLYEYTALALRSLDINVAQGQFGADMKIALINDGPTTIWLDI